MHRNVSSVARGIVAACTALGVVACGSSSPTGGGQHAASITVSPPTASLAAGDSVALTATVKDAQGNTISNPTITWSASDTDAVAISASGVVSTLLPATDTITATSDGVSGTAVVTVQAPTPIQMHEGGLVGTVTFPNGSTASGGQGDPVDTIPCGSGADAEHYHVHLSLFVNGQQQAMPLGVGIDNAVVVGDSLAIAGTCFYWLHAHDRTGIIHVEPAETGHTFTLGEYFDIWGEPLTSSNVAGNQGDVTVYIDGARYLGDPRAIVLAAHQQITLEVGTRVAPPVYAFPPDY
ncbi:MAG TPA: Ig-like domain-containing protein [Gemmatimonadaceae bacterium]|nr:Ig-like domain-containing protein [Gemmatimonadaceae bacterium]